MKVMQCWDDAVANDVRLSDLLRKHNAKATFNIIFETEEKPRRSWMFNEFKVEKLPLNEMKDVYSGFKVAGHGGIKLSLIPMDKLKIELAENKVLIKEHFGQDKCGYAYPGGDYSDELKIAVRDAGYLYARTCKNVDGVLPLDDPMTLHSHCHFLSPEFWSKYEKVRELDGIFYFWGHSYEMKDDNVLWSDFESKLARISNDPKVEWIDIIDLFA